MRLQKQKPDIVVKAYTSVVTRNTQILCQPLVTVIPTVILCNTYYGVAYIDI